MTLSSLINDLTLIDEPDCCVTTVFIVIVLYRMRPAESPTLQSLLAALRAIDDTCMRLTVSIADNTPGGQQVGDLPSGVRYQAFPDNPGLAAPYNLAIAQAEAKGYQWLLTLDQDTQLPSFFLTELAEQIRRYNSQSRVAAIVPRIFDRGIPISPLRFAGGFFPVVVGDGVNGILGPHATALNSASLLRISALKEIGGYDINFPLNNSDTAMFHRLDRAGFGIVLAADLVVEHELAIMRREDRMSAERYRQLLVDERNFWNTYMSPWARMERLLRLGGRLLKGFAVNEDAVFRRITLDELRQRIFPRRPAERAKRIEHGALHEVRSSAQDRRRRNRGKPSQIQP